MTGHGNETSRSEKGPPPASTGILFVLGCFGLFYSLIEAVDPFL